MPATTTNPTEPPSSTTSSNESPGTPLDTDHTYNAGWRTASAVEPAAAELWPLAPVRILSVEAHLAATHGCSRAEGMTDDVNADAQQFCEAEGNRPDSSKVFYRVKARDSTWR